MNIIKNDIDIVEEEVYRVSRPLLEVLLEDKTTKRNIIWATSSYEYLGEGFSVEDEITPLKITGANYKLIQPRTAKAKDEQSARTKDKAEVFTPSWVCNVQNNLIDEQWFGRKNVFNTELDCRWKVNSKRINFGDKNWQEYVTENRIEITCGEAPYLVSRYDTVTGDYIDVKRRIGLLDRKLRVISENTINYDTWLKWVKKAYQSTYGFEYQGDNLLLARENLLYTFIDNCEDNFGFTPPLSDTKEIANIIVWNIWQMDGLTKNVPFGKPLSDQMSIFEEETESFDVQCKIQDWKNKKKILFSSLVKE